MAAISRQLAASSFGRHNRTLLPPRHSYCESKWPERLRCDRLLRLLGGVDRHGHRSRIVVVKIESFSGRPLAIACEGHRVALACYHRMVGAASAHQFLVASLLND